MFVVSYLWLCYACMCIALSAIGDMITISTTITTTTTATNTTTKTITTTATIVSVSYPGTKAHSRNVHSAENWHAINANVTITTAITIKPDNVTVSKQISNDMFLQVKHVDSTAP